MGTRVLNQGGIDCNYCFHEVDDCYSTAELFSPTTGLGVNIKSDLPGLQCYTGSQMKTNYKGKYGRSYGPGFGICLEPQFYPDAINQPNFPSPILKADQVYQKTITMQFRNDYPLSFQTR